MLGEFANFVRDNGEPTAGFSGARGLDGGVESQQVGLLGDVVDDVDDFGDFQGAIAERLDLAGGGLHGRTDALHSFERVAHGAVALFGGVEGAARGFGAGFGVVGHLFHGNRQLFDGRRRIGDFLILLPGARAHLVRGDENAVGIGGNFDSRFADAVEYRREII